MTVSSTLSRQTFACNGTTTVFTLPFRVLAATEVVGYLIAVADNSATQLSNGIDFTVSGVGAANAVVTTTATYSVAYQLKFVRSTQRLQLTDYRDNDPFPAEAHEEALDRLTHISQEQDGLTGRALLFPEPEAGQELPSASSRAGKSLAFDENGRPVVLELSEIDGVIGTAFSSERFTATAGQTLFTLTSGSYTPGTDAFRLFMDGRRLTVGVDYAETSPTSFTLTAPAAAGDELVADLGKSVTSGVLATAVSHTPPGGTAGSLSDYLNREVWIENYGADPTGVVSASTAIAAAIAQIGAGGGTVRAGRGTFALGSQVTVPPYVNIVGAGLEATEFKSTAAAGRVLFERGSSDGRGGLSGGFTINGNGIGEQLLKSEIMVERTFVDINVIRSATDNIVLEGAQNCGFYNVHSQQAERDNLVLNAGAGNNNFFGGEFNQGGRYNIAFLATVTAPTLGDAGAFAEPTNNRFFGAIIERLGWDGTTADPDNGTALVYHGAGKFNSFHDCSFSLPGLDSTTKSMIVVEKAGTNPSLVVTLTDCFYAGTASRTTAIEARANTSVVLCGRQNFETHAAALSIADTAIVSGAFVPTLGSVTSYFVNQGGGTQPQQNLIQTEFRQRFQVANPAGFVSYGARADGDTFNSTEIRPGGVRLGTGSAAADRDIAPVTRHSIDGVEIDGTSDPANFVLKVGAIDILIVNAAPTQAAPNGSIALRTNGGGGTTFYVRESGAWVGK